MDVWLTLALNGISEGALYFLMASGLTLIFGLMQVVNFAHGSLYLWGAYVAASLYLTTHQFIISLVGGAAVAFLIGVVVEKGLIAPVYRNPTGQLLMTMGVLLVLSECIKLPFGNNPVSTSAPNILSGSWLVAHVAIVKYQLFTVAAGVIIFIALKLVLLRTRLGTIIRAGVSNPELVEARGIPIRRIFTWVFGIGAGLAGLAGALAGPYFGSVSPTMGFDMQLNAFIIIVVGGIGSLDGALIGSLLIGIVTALVSYYFSSFAVLVNVLVMAGVLLIRPQGLLGRKEALS